jgi:pyridoxal phosphate enzyme (YggS family)
MISCFRVPLGTNMDSSTESRLKGILSGRLEALEERMEAACRRAGRNRSEITLVAVTKTVSAEIAALLPSLGVLDLGESRPQELWRKATILPETVRWHQVGHLQRNKVAATLPWVRLIHSVDSGRLLSALELEAGKINREVDVLLEVNVSGEVSKHGFEPHEFPEVMKATPELTRVRITGLMTMAAFEEEPERCRPTFAELRRLRDQWRSNLSPPHHLDHLSMGMSNDFEVAIEEGATIVRLGTVLFEGLSYQPEA